MSISGYDIFISYRRSDGFATARLIYDRLTRVGYRVSFDLETLRSGNFNTQLYARINQCRDVIVIMSRDALDFRSNPDEDWMRLEISYALKQSRNIIPVFLRDVAVPPPSALPEDVRAITLMNGVTASDEHFDSTMAKIRRLLESKPRWRSWLPIALLTPLLVVAAVVGIRYGLRNIPGAPERRDTSAAFSRFADYDDMVIRLTDSVELPMVKIKAGTLLMKFHYPSKLDERQHRVKISKDYWLGKFEVTNRQWCVVMDTDPSDNLLPIDTMNNVSGEDARKFCDRLNEIYASDLPPGYRFDLPTEAQWVYACRAGTADSPDNREKLSEVDRNAAHLNSGNALGLHHMLDKVSEWCRESSFHWPDTHVPVCVIRNDSDVCEFEDSDSRSEARGFRIAITPGSLNDAKTMFRHSPTVAGENYTLKLNDDATLTMVKIKAGSFMMGSPVGEMGRYDDEKQHVVTLTEDYWIGKYEVTQGQWKAVTGDNPSGWRSGDDYPVTDVSWKDAKIFCRKLNALYKSRLPPGYCFDLPTEAQWEYACRAGTTTALNSGKNLISEEDGYRANLNELGWYGNPKDFESPTHGGCMTCTVMWRNGAAIGKVLMVGMRLIRPVRPKESNG